MNAFNKHPLETYPIAIDYTGKAPDGASLSSGVWAAVDMLTGDDASGDVLASTTAVITGSVAKCRVENGTLGSNYRLSLTAIFDTGDTLHDNIYMYITEDA